MGRLSWVNAPTIQPLVTVPDPPPTDDPALADWMRQVKQALDTLAQPNAEAQAFLDDLIDVVKEIDRDSLNDLDTISDTAGATYTTAEQTMLANLKTAVNGLLANL